MKFRLTIICLLAILFGSVSMNYLQHNLLALTEETVNLQTKSHHQIIDSLHKKIIDCES